MRAPGVVLIDPKFSHNVGATIRACSCFGIESFVWTGSRIELSKYQRLPREERMKGYKSVQFENHQRPFDLFDHFTPVCVEVYEQSEPLTTFEHPENALSPVPRPSIEQSDSGILVRASIYFGVLPVRKHVIWKKAN